MKTVSNSSNVWTFFYGSYINLAVLKEVDLVPEQYEVARLSGFDIRIQPLATLVRSEQHCVFGIVTTATHDELARLYRHATDVLGGVYLPEAVLCETTDGTLRPALCYIASSMEPQTATNEYVDRIVGPAREYGFPMWYIKRLEMFRAHPLLRETRFTELGSICEMENTNAREFILEFILPYSLEQHQAEFAKESVRYLSIDVGGKLSGFVILSLDDDGRSVEFRRIVIAEPGRGLGSAALKLVEAYCTGTLKRNRIWLDVFKSNARARHVYEKHGFTSFGTKAHGERTLVLYERLAGSKSECEPQGPRVGP